jgi:hypothetical protein
MAKIARRPHIDLTVGTRGGKVSARKWQWDYVPAWLGRTESNVQLTTSTGPPHDDSLPDHESPLRRLMADAAGRQYVA